MDVERLEDVCGVLWVLTKRRKLRLWACCQGDDDFSPDRAKAVGAGANCTEVTLEIPNSLLFARDTAYFIGIFADHVSPRILLCLLIPNLPARPSLGKPVAQPRSLSLLLLTPLNQ